MYFDFKSTFDSIKHDQTPSTDGKYQKDHSDLTGLSIKSKK